MDLRPVVAQWAWISKEPGSPEDYGIRAASKGPINVGGFAGAYVAGVPSSSLPEDAPGSAPWVTFGSHLTGAGRPVLSVSVQDPWRGQDQARRPIWPQRFFLCRYDDLAAARASYRTLWDAVASISLPGPDDQPIPVGVRPQRLGDVAAAVNDIGFDQVAAIAAALLDGPVAVTGTAGLRLTASSAASDRLAVLDAVAALLPYGFRADLSGSTAVDNTVIHRMRLVLAEYANGGQQAIPLRGAPGTPRSELARDYLTMLLDKKRWDGLNTVIAHLWDAADACSFGRAEAALEILDGLNQRRHKIRAAHEGAEGLALSRAFFRDEPSHVEQLWHSAELDEPTRGKLLRPLLEAGDPDGILPRHWPVVADDYTALVRHRLDRGDLGCAARALAAAGAQTGPEAADRLLRTLVGPPQASRGSRERDIALRAELLWQRTAPPPGTFGLTRMTLRLGGAAEWAARLVRELLAGEIAADPSSGRALAWASWLSGPEAAKEATEEPVQEAADWVAALSCMVTHTEVGPTGVTRTEGTHADGNAGCDGVRSLFQQDATWTAIALNLASESGHLDHVLGIPGLAGDLVGQAAVAADRLGQVETRRMLAAALREASGPPGLDPAVLAALDAARLLLGGQPSGFPDIRTQPELSRYDEGLRWAFGHPSVRAAQPSLATRFLGWLTQAGSARGFPDGTVWLLQAWSQDEQLTQVLAAFAVAYGATAAVARDRRLDHDFWARLTAVQPALRPALAISLLRGAVEQAIADPATLRRYADERFGVPASALALALYRARRSGVPVAQIVEVIRDTPVRDLTLVAVIGPRELDDVLCELGFLLACPTRGADGGPALHGSPGALAEFRELMCAGALGAGYGAEFRRFLSRRLKDEEATRRRLRIRLRRPSRPFGRRRPEPAAPVPAVAAAGEE